MTASAKRGTAAAVALSVVLSLVPATQAAPSPGRLEGVLLDLDGRPARDHRVVLIDEAGGEAGVASTDERGLYSFSGLAPGRYALGVENPDGAAAPVFAPPVELSGGELARRDVRLMQTTGAQLDDGLAANYGLRIWWAGRSKREKVAWVAGAIVGVALLWYLLHEDDEDQPVSSALLPTE